MAAILWRSVLAGELATAILFALAVTALGSLQAWTALPIAFGAIVLIQYLLAAGSMLTARALALENDAPLTALWFARATVSESVSFWFAKLAMSAEPWLRGFEPSRGASARASRPVLLVHGLACNRGVWRWLLPRLHAAGFPHVHAVNLEPVRSDIDRLADAVERELLAMHRAYEGARVTIIAHSMGGLVARAVLRSLGSDVIKHVITLATPHHGAAIARVLQWPATRQMSPGSSWLAALNASQEGRWRVPLTSIYSLEDNLVAPARSPVLLGAKLHEMRGLGHFGLLASRRALDCVMSALEDGG
jgi:triacylglycerol esterase/lipase EstA (alpha/beta hydrolase family)